MPALCYGFAYHRSARRLDAEIKCLPWWRPTCLKAGSGRCCEWCTIARWHRSLMASSTQQASVSSITLNKSSWAGAEQYRTIRTESSRPVFASPTSSFRDHAGCYNVDIKHEFVRLQGANRVSLMADQEARDAFIEQCGGGSRYNPLLFSRRAGKCLPSPLPSPSARERY